MGRVSLRPHPAQAPRRAGRPRRPGGLPRLRGEPLRHRPDLVG